MYFCLKYAILYAEKLVAGVFELITVKVTQNRCDFN